MRDCKDCKHFGKWNSEAKCFVCSGSGSAAIRFEPKNDSKEEKQIVEHADT